MEIQIERSSEPDEKEWNTILSQSKTAHVYNTIEWAKIAQETLGYKPIYYTVKEKNIPVGCFHIFEKSAIPEGIAKHISRIRFTYASPIIISENKKEILHELLSEVIKDAKKEGIASINIWDTPYLDESEAFESMGFSNEEKHNILIDLRSSPDESFQELEKGLRKNIRHAIESLKTSASFIDTPTQDDLEEYYSLYDSHHAQIGIESYPCSYLQSIWDRLITKDLAKFFIIKYDNKIGAGLIFSTFNNRMYEMSVASSGEYHAMFPNDLLKWKAIEWGIKNNYELFDISNVPVNPKEGTKEHGILRFKKKWGRIAKYHAYKKTGILGHLWNIKKNIMK